MLVKFLANQKEAAGSYLTIKLFPCSNKLFFEMDLSPTLPYSCTVYIGLFGGQH